MSSRELDESELFGDSQKKAAFIHAKLYSDDFNVAGVLAKLAKALEDLATTIYTPESPQVEDEPSEEEPKDQPEEVDVPQPQPELCSSVSRQTEGIEYRWTPRPTCRECFEVYPGHSTYYVPPQLRSRSLPPLRRKYSSFLLDPELLHGPGRGYFSRRREREELVQDWNGEYRSKLAFLGYL